jgi:hypothetical protein
MVFLGDLLLYLWLMVHHSQQDNSSHLYTQTHPVRLFRPCVSNPHSTAAHLAQLHSPTADPTTWTHPPRRCEVSAASTRTLLLPTSLVPVPQATDSQPVRGFLDVRSLRTSIRSWLEAPASGLAVSKFLGSKVSCSEGLGRRKRRLAEVSSVPCGPLCCSCH